MSTTVVIPSTLRGAGRELRRAFATRLNQLPKADFIRAWCAVAYLFPGLHPDGYDEPGSGWPRVLQRFAAEAWRLAEMGELDDEELYPSDAAWSGIYDRLGEWETDEIVRRLEIAAAHGASPDA